MQTARTKTLTKTGGESFIVAAHVRLLAQDRRTSLPADAPSFKVFPAHNLIGGWILGGAIKATLERNGVTVETFAYSGELNNWTLVCGVTRGKEKVLELLKTELIRHMISLDFLVQVGYLCPKELIWRSYFPNDLPFAELDMEALRGKLDLVLTEFRQYIAKHGGKS